MAEEKMRCEIWLPDNFPQYGEDQDKTVSVLINVPSSYWH